jgi:DNA polymerase elongation subunit (family B)
MTDKSYLFYTERKAKIHVKEYDHDTKTSKWAHHDFAPKLLIATDDESARYRSTDDRPLKLLNLNSIREARNFVKELDDAARDLYGFRKYDSQFICQANYKDASPDHFSIVYHDIETEVHDKFPDPAVAKEPINMITMIQRYGKAFALTTCPVKAAAVEEEFKSIGLKVEQFDSEDQMLRRFVDIFSLELRVDIFTGWNSEKFDMPYIVNRIKRVCGSDTVNRLSPFGEVFLRTFTDDFGDEAVTAEIVGVNHVDMIHLFKKFSHESQESYSLENIATVELGVGKLQHESGIPGHLLYHEHPTDGLRYNIIDVVRLMEIDLKKGLIDLAIIVANMTKLNISDVVFSTRLWMNMIYDYLAQRDRFFEFRSERKDYRKIEGGFVSCNLPGLVEFGGSFDYASLYPNTMMALNVGPDSKGPKLSGVNPDTLINGDVKAPEGYSMGANGQCFRLDKRSFLVEIIDHGYQLRKHYKNLKLYFEMCETKSTVEEMFAVKILPEIADDVEFVMKNVRGLEFDEAKKIITRNAKLYKNYDSSIKTILNSCYGALAEKNFQFYDPDVAESITVTGQYMVRNLGNTFISVLEKNYGSGKYLIAQDTDSCYVQFKAVIDKQFGGKDVPETEQIEWLCKYADGPMKKVVKIANEKACKILNAFDPTRFDADREAIFRRGVFVKKKMYALALSDMEGVRFKEPKLKIVGLQAKKKSTPKFFRDKMETFFKIFLNGDMEGSIKFMSEIEREFYEADIDDIAGNVSVSDLSSKINENNYKGYDQGTHINARAAIVANNFVQRDEKARMYIEPIRNGDKIKLIPMKVPNPLNSENVLAWKDTWPAYYDQAELRKYIDWRTHFQKAFRNPLDRIYAVCGINPDFNTMDMF